MGRDVHSACDGKSTLSHAFSDGPSATVRSVASVRIHAAVLLAAALSSCARAPLKAASGPSGAGCPAQLRLLLGACVSPAIAAKACGAAALATLDGCAPRPPCEPGRARDLETGECLPHRDTRAIATSLGLLVGEDELLSCPDGGQLATGAVEDTPPGPRIGCLPARLGRSVVCPVGELPGPSGPCQRVGDGARIDVVRWLHAAIGPDGGAGAPPLCAALAQSPGALANAGPREVRVQVAVVFPDNDVTQVSATVHGAGAGPGELEHVVAPLIEALRSLGGVASQASIITAVRCHRISERPSVGQIR